MSLIWWSLIGLPFSDDFIQTMLNRRKTWWTFPCICRSLHLLQLYLWYGQRDTDTNTLLVTFKCPKFLPLIRFLSFNIASAYFRLKNLTITLLSWPLLFLERGSGWQPSISLAFTSIPYSLQMLLYSPNLQSRCCSVCLIIIHYSFGYTAPFSPNV